MIRHYLKNQKERKPLNGNDIVEQKIMNHKGYKISRWKSQRDEKKKNKKQEKI